MGTGEITRYIAKNGTKRLRKAVLIGTLGPYLVKAADNPEGVDRKAFDDTRAALKADRPATLMEFLKNFYSVGGEDGKRVGERVIDANWAVGIGASPIGTIACVVSWIEDFRKDIPRNDVPTMIIHGDDDRILPPDATSRRQAKMIYMGYRRWVRRRQAACSPSIIARMKVERIGTHDSKDMSHDP
jgi:non-heme chloroperoxidase